MKKLPGWCVGVLGGRPSCVPGAATGIFLDPVVESTIQSSHEMNIVAWLYFPNYCLLGREWIFSQGEHEVLTELKKTYEWQAGDTAELLSVAPLARPQTRCARTRGIDYFHDFWPVSWCIIQTQNWSEAAISQVYKKRRAHTLKISSERLLKKGPVTLTKGYCSVWKHSGCWFSVAVTTLQAKRSPSGILSECPFF